MSTLVRSFWFAVATILYVVFASLQADPRGWSTWLLLVAAPLGLWLTWRYTGTLIRLGERDPEVRRDCIRAATTGALLFVGARTGPLGHPGFDAAANLGVGITLVAANVALARIQGRGGLLNVPATTRSLDSAIFAALLWGIATTLPALRSVVSRSLLVLDPVAIDYATITAAMASLLLMLAVALRLRFLRRLELDVADRAISVLTVAGVALLATLPALFFDLVAPDRAVPTVVIASALFYVWAAGATDARRVTSSLRAMLAILTFLSPIVLFLALWSRSVPHLGPILIVVAAATGVTLGLFSARLSRPLAPEQSRWLDSINRASEAALVPDPDDALRATLVALGPVAPGPSSRVELWRLHPASVLYVDIAGQLHDESAQIPDATVELSGEEPERTLRVDVLRATQVRNPLARESLRHFETRNIYAATLLTSESGPLGLLALPEGHRKSALSLEETVALRRLADRLESVLAITSAQARSRRRELEALAQLEAMTAEARRLASVAEQEGSRQRRFAERYARHLRPTIYSPSARSAQITLERLAKISRELSIVLPPGADALGWASLAHLASPRHSGPFVVFDAAAQDFGAENWDDPECSPLAIAETGTWVLLNPKALDATQRQLLVRTWTRHKAARDLQFAQNVGMILAWHLGHVPSGAEAEVDPDDELWRMFPPDTRVTVPALVDRAEDLRAIIYERAARLGAILKGRPLGVDPSALAILLEHAWPLNDLELDATLHALVLASTDDVITRETVTRVSLGQRFPSSGSPEIASSASALPVRRRSRSGAASIRPKER